MLRVMAGGMGKTVSILVFTLLAPRPHSSSRPSLLALLRVPTLVSSGSRAGAWGLVMAATTFGAVLDMVTDR